MFGSSLARCFKNGATEGRRKSVETEIVWISQVLFSLENIPIFLLEYQTTIFTIFHFHSFNAALLPFQNIFDCSLYRASEAGETNFTVLKLSSIFILKMQ